MTRPPATGSTTTMRPPALPQRPAGPVRRPGPPALPPRPSVDRRAIRDAVRRRRRAEAGERRPGPGSRRRPRWGALAVLVAPLALVGVPAVLAFAPVFTVTRVVVPGATEDVAAQVRAALDGQRGRPLALVSDEDVARGLEAVPAVETYTVVRRPPAVLEVRVAERTPVAQERTPDGWGIVDAAHVVMRTVPAADPDLPVVAVEPGAVSPAAAFRTVVSALAALDAADLTAARVQAASADDVVLELEGGVRVRWGGAEDGTAKAEALRAALVRAAQDAREIDVSSPGVVRTR